jgi:hypothetical protein
MSVEFPVDNQVVRRYVEQLPPRTRGNANAYCCLLGQFIRFVSQRSVDGGISREVLQAWFQHRIERLPIHSVLERVSLLDHFLDWLVAHDLIAANPFAELRRAYGEGKRPRIVQALLRPDADAALDALRPVPRFASHLGAVMQEHETCFALIVSCSNGLISSASRWRCWRTNGPKKGRPPSTPWGAP